MTPIPENSPSVRAAARAATGRGGVTRNAVAEAVGVCPKYAGRLLAVAKRQGLVASVCIGDCTWLWMSPAEADLMRLQLKVQRRQRERLRHRAMAKRERLARGMKPSAAPAAVKVTPVVPRDAVELDDSPIVRRLGVDPRAPLPFVCRAPSSVFALGASL